MARLGAKVVGIDASEQNIKVAKHHLKKTKLNIKYLNTSPEKFKTNKLDNNLKTFEYWVTNIYVFMLPSIPMC